MLAGPISWGLLILLGLPDNQATPSLSQFAIIALVYPVVEEIVFRAGIQHALLTRPAFSRSMSCISIANVITSLLFAAAHLFNQQPLWAALIIAPSLVFGWAYERYRTVIAPILLHMFYNTGFIALLLTV